MERKQQLLEGFVEFDPSFGRPDVDLGQDGPVAGLEDLHVAG